MGTFGACLVTRYLYQRRHPAVSGAAATPCLRTTTPRAKRLHRSQTRDSAPRFASEFGSGIRSECAQTMPRCIASQTAVLSRTPSRSA